EDGIKDPAKKDGEDPRESGYAVPIEDALFWNGIENCRETSAKCFKHSCLFWRLATIKSCHADMRRRGFSACAGAAIYLPRCAVARQSCKQECDSPIS